jgi:DNA invertase Pin-like site-specific DNA recombinase
MATGRYIAYYRVSTARQERSGLGLDAQCKAVTDYLNGGNWQLVGEHTEIESGKNNQRPQLQGALAACRSKRATLVVAKLDRLSRDAAFLLTLQNSGADFVAADMPDANQLTVSIMAVVAQQEREAISKRTKEAFARSKKPLGGYRLGAEARAAALGGLGAAAGRAKANARAADLAELRASGATSLATIAAGLNAGGHTAPRGGSWTKAQVLRLLVRLPKAA